MRKLLYAMSVSLDGYIEAAGGDLGWSFPDAELHQHFNDRERSIEVQLYGRRLYETMNAYWPTAGLSPGDPPEVVEYARIWRSKPRVVFSTTLKQVEGNARLARGDLAEEVGRLKREGDGEMIVGGAGLAGSCMRLGLIDEVRLYVAPVILGGGKPMFGPLKQPIKLRLEETRRFGGGVMMLRYLVEGQ